MVWGTFGNHSFALKPIFLNPKSCLHVNDAATATVLYQSNHQSNHQCACFLVMVHSQKKVKMQYCDKRLSFPGVTACNLRHLNRFPSQGGNRIYRHYSCILMRVSPAISKSFWRFSFFYIGNPNYSTERGWIKDYKSL